ncbi:MAG: complex I subunit 1 family protein [Terriglobales bacterium]|jgi:NADH-quinone oxidoreductase subunit H
MLDYVTSYLHSNVTPGQAGNWLWALIYIALIFAGVSGIVIVMNWGERKALAHMQVRLGPMRVGPHGLMQPIADAIKLLTKEDIMPSEADKPIFWMAPVWVVMIAFSVFIVVPFGPTHAVTDMNIGILFMLGVSSLGVLGVVMAGWASNSHFPLMGALRSSAQMVSYEIAMGLAVISAVVMTGFTGLGAYGIGDAGASGTLSMIGIVQAQAQQHVWFLFKFFPVGLVAFFIFAVAMVAETNRAPFDLPEAESELVAGFHTEYSGLRWSLFMLGEYAAMVAVSSIAITLWLGGWLRPFPSVHGPAINIPFFWEHPELGVVDFVFSFAPAMVLFVLAFFCFFNAARMPKHPLLKIQTMGLYAFGLVLGGVGLILLAPPVRDRIQDIFWFVFKIACFMYMYIWYRATWPRYRFDQLMKVGWKVLLPLGLGVLLMTGIIGLSPEILRWLKGVV